jgi:perosamine synthetase
MNPVSRFFSSFYRQEYLRVDWDKEEQYVWATPAQDKRGQLVKLLQPRYPKRDILLVQSGRAALRLAIRALDLQGKRIAVPALICASVIRAIKAENSEPIFIDVEEDFTIDLQSLTKAIKQHRAAAVLVPHFGGIASNIEEVSALCRQHKVLVIEDAAQSFGLRIGKVDAGNFGDAAILSFGIGKVISSFDGGALLIDRRKAKDVLSEIMPAKEPSLAYRIGFWARYVKRRSLLPFFLVKDAVTQLLPKQDRILSLRAMSKTDAAVLVQQVAKANSIMERTAQHASAYFRQLPKLIAVPKKGNNYLKLMIRVKNRKRILEELRREGVETECSFLTACAQQSAKLPFPKSERLSRELLSLPIHPKLKQQDIERICRILRRIT